MSDGTKWGTFAQVTFTDGNRVLVSLAKKSPEIQIKQLGFLALPKRTIYKTTADEFLSKIPPFSLNPPTGLGVVRGYIAPEPGVQASLLQFVTALVLTRHSIDEIPAVLDNPPPPDTPTV